MQTFNQEVNQRQNTTHLEQQIYSSPENFTPTLLVMLETFKRSGKAAKMPNNGLQFVKVS